MEPNSRAAFSYRWLKLQESAGDRPLAPLSTDEHTAYWQIAQEILDQDKPEDPFKKRIVNLLNDQFADAGHAVVLRLPQSYAFSEYVALLELVWTADEMAQYRKDRSLPRKIQDISRDDAIVWLSVHDARGSGAALPEVEVDERRLLDQRTSLFLFYMGEVFGTKVIPSEHMMISRVAGTNKVHFEIKPSYLEKHAPRGWWVRSWQEETARLEKGWSSTASSQN